MAADIQANIGLDSSGFELGAQKAKEALEGLRGGAARLAAQLERQNRQLTQTKFEQDLYRISLLKVGEEQRAALVALAHRNEAERSSQELSKQRTAALAQEQAAEARRVASIEQSINALKREALAARYSAEQIKLMDLQAQGASHSQLVHAAGLMQKINELKKNRQAEEQRVAALEQARNRLQPVNVGSLVFGAAAIGGTSGIIKMADEWQTLQNRLKLVHSTQLDVIQAQEGILSIANQTGQGFANVATVYENFASNQKALNLSNQDLLRVTNAVSKAMVVGGSSAQGAQAALTQFGQALGAGVLRGDEFNSVMEQAPGLALALARGLDVSTAQLRGLAKDGQLTADVVTRALQKSATSIDEDFNKMSKTIGQSFEVLKNKLTEFVGKGAQASGTIKLLSGAILTIANNLDLLAGGIGVLLAGSLAKWAIMSTARLVQLGASMWALRAGTLATVPANIALSHSIATMGAASALSSFQITSLSEALAVVRVSMMATLSALLPISTAFVAAIAGVEGFRAALNFLKGEDASNAISRMVENLAGLDGETESLGTKLYDWLHPIKQVNQQLSITAEKIKGISQYSAVSFKIQQAGGLQQFQMKDLNLDKLSSEINKVVVKYEEQLQSIGKSKEELDKLSLSLAKENYLKKTRLALEERYKNQPNSYAKINADLKATTDQVNRDVNAALSAMDRLTQAKQRQEEHKQAMEDAKKRASEIQSTIKDTQFKFDHLGSTEQELARLQLAAKGASDAQLNQITAMQAVIREYEKQRSVMANIEDLQNQYDRIGKSADNVKLMDLASKGASLEQLSMARNLIAKMAERENDFKRFQSASETVGKAGNMFQSASESLMSLAELTRYAAQKKEQEKNNEQMLRDAANSLKSQHANQTYESKFNRSQGEDGEVHSGSSKSWTPQVKEMGKITLDMRFPDGKALTGVLFGEEAFLEKLKTQTNQNIEEFIAKTATAVN